MENVYQIINVAGHYEAYRHDRFICSGDTEKEIRNEIYLYEIELSQRKPKFKPGNIVHPKKSISMNGVGVMYTHNHGKIISLYNAKNNEYGYAVLLNTGKIFIDNESNWELSN